MALQDKIREAENAQVEVEEELSELTSEEEVDLRIAVNIAEDLIDQGGYDVIQQAMDTSNDPAQVIGQFIIQMGMQMMQELPQEIVISRRIFLAEGGWVEQIMDYLQEEYDVPKDVTDRAEVYVATTVQQMAQQEQQPQAAPEQQVAAPSMPQGGV